MPKNEFKWLSFFAKEPPKMFNKLINMRPTSQTKLS